jgi:hypothetical protein
MCIYTYTHTRKYIRLWQNVRPTHFLDNHMVLLVNDQGNTHQFKAWPSKLFNNI